MLSPIFRARCDRIFCFLVKDDKSLIDDDTNISIFNPIRIGSSILLCGKRKSYFPFQCMVGPDWPIVVLVYIMIIGINSIILGVISPIGWPPVLIGLIGSIVLLFTYSCVACSDPGIIYKNDYERTEEKNPGDEESLTASNENQGDSNNITTNRSNSRTVIINKVPETIECGQCQLNRPFSGRHCHYCKVCIDELDHHCPWCGKCIGKENMKFFSAFLSMLCLQFYYLLGVLVYYLVDKFAFQNLPTGPSFSNR